MVFSLHGMFSKLHAQQFERKSTVIASLIAAADLELYQESRLPVLLNHCNENVHYYSRLFDEIGLIFLRYRDLINIRIFL